MGKDTLLGRSAPVTSRPFGGRGGERNKQVLYIINTAYILRRRITEMGRLDFISNESILGDAKVHSSISSFECVAGVNSSHFGMKSKCSRAQRTGMGMSGLPPCWARAGTSEPGSP